VVATLEDLDEPALKRILTEPKNALSSSITAVRDGDHRSHAGEEALGAIAKGAIGARRRAGWLDHGDILLTPMFTSEPGRRRGGGISREVVEGTAGRSTLRRPLGSGGDAGGASA